MSYCRCGEPAIFFCPGPLCDGAVAHCGRHRRAHPGGLAAGYCLDCHDEVFPACVTADCAITAIIACEFVAGTGLRACARRACPGHAWRWQIFGPHQRGLGLCPEHGARLQTLTTHQLVFQIVAGTAGRPGGARLPSLGALRATFVNVRGQLLDPCSADDLYTGLASSLGDSPLEQRMRRLIGQDSAQRAADIAELHHAEAAGEKHITRLRQAMRDRGHHDLAESVRLSAFQHRADLLFVRMPQALLGRLLGPGGSTLRGLSAELGVEIRVERP